MHGVVICQRSNNEQMRREVATPPKPQQVSLQQSQCQMGGTGCKRGRCQSGTVFNRQLAATLVTGRHWCVLRSPSSNCTRAIRLSKRLSGEEMVSHPQAKQTRSSRKGVSGVTGKTIKDKVFGQPVSLVTFSIGYQEHVKSLTDWHILGPPNTNN